ncbi:MAG: efflux RND transporter periplasmic adaptor subunit [Chloroflexi bacterium]|nr:efflux RND transporter periplasmic adaptor subunit [Chloroflexota bacterium]
MSRRTWYRWAAALLLIPLLAACAAPPPTPTGQAKPSGEGGQRPVGVPVSVRPVGRGNLAATFTYSGSIQSRASVNVLPRATGRIERLYVDVGSPVKAGDVIAELDRTQLDAQVRQAEGALQNAQARLDLLLAGARPEDVEAARAALQAAEARLAQMLQGGRSEDVAAAEANLQAAQARLNQLLEGPTEAEVAAARAAVDSAKANLQSSQQRLQQLLAGGSPEEQRQADAAVEQALARREALRNPPADQLAAARTALDQAEATRAAAQARLDQLLAGGAIADQVAAQAAVDSARSSLQAAEERLAALLSGGTPADREAAQAAYDQALAQYRGARERYLALQQQANASDPANSGQQLTDLRQQVAQAQQNVQIKCGTTTSPSSSTLAPAALSPDCIAAQAALDRANQQLQNLQASVNRLTPRVSAADLASARAAVEQADAQLKAAQARIDQLNNPTPDAVQAARTAVDTARANLDAALARQEQLRNPSPDTLASAQSAVESAEAAVRSARARLELLQAGGSPEDIRAADAAVEQAQARRDQLRNPSAADIANARAAVDTAAANLSSAESRLADVLAGPKAADLQAAVSAVDQAQQTLILRRFPNTPQEIQQQQEAVAQARANLALRSQPNRPEDIAQARASVEQARAALDLARAQAAEAVIYAPFAGVVSAKLLSEGALASPTTPVVTLVTNEVEVVVNIEEARIGQVHEGSPAVLTVSAYPGEEFPAVVAMVSPTADPRSRTFQAKVVPQNPEGKLKEGMFAQVRITGEERQNVLVVPNNAIVQRAGRSVAFVAVDGRAQLRELQLGITDGRQTEVLSGLQDGDQLIVAGQETLNDGDQIRITQGAPAS